MEPRIQMARSFWPLVCNTARIVLMDDNGATSCHKGVACAAADLGQARIDRAGMPVWVQHPITRWLVFDRIYNGTAQQRQKGVSVWIA